MSIAIIKNVHQKKYVNTRNLYEEIFVDNPYFQRQMQISFYWIVKHNGSFFFSNKIYVDHEFVFH